MQDQQLQMLDAILLHIIAKQIQTTLPTTLVGILTVQHILLHALQLAFSITEMQQQQCHA